MSQGSPIIHRLRELARIASAEPGGERFEALTDEAAAGRHVRYYLDLLRLVPTPIAGATVLDAGCGYGEASVLFAALGARRVLAVDLGDDEIAAVERVRARLGEVGDRIEPVHASVMDLPLPDGSVDLVVSNEGIGTCRDLDQFLDECARVLRPGGSIVMAELNDVANPRLARRARTLWRAYELGPVGDHDGHVVSDPLVEQRRRVARDLLPDHDDATARVIAERTYRHDRDALGAAVQRFVDDGVLPDAPFDPEQPPIDLRGPVVEAPVDPSWMRDALRRRSLLPKVVGYWGGAEGQPLVRLVDRALEVLSPVLLRTARAVRYTGTKL